MTALNQLATRLRLNAASMEHGEAEADIRAAADILDIIAMEALNWQWCSCKVIRDAFTRARGRTAAACHADLSTQPTGLST